MKIILVDDVEKEMKRDLKDIAGGRFCDKIVLTPETFVKVFSPQRIRLLLEIKKGDHGSITGLAEKLDRKFEAVHRDISYLKGFGIVKINKSSKNVVAEVVEKLDIPMIV